MDNRQTPNSRKSWWSMRRSSSKSRTTKREANTTPLAFIRPVVAYTSRYGAAFFEAIRVGAYEANVDDNDTSVVHVRT